MTTTLEIPDELAASIVGSSASPSRAVLEAVAADAHRRGCITAFQVRQLLGHDSRWETQAFLCDRQAFSELSVGEILEDVATIETLRQSK
jgi:Uncharacterised protein family (UPF0175)